MKKNFASIVIAFAVIVAGCRTSDDGKTVLTTDWVKIQSSTFAMGNGINEDSNEYPVHNVELSSYLICVHEVTQSEYEKYCKYSVKSPNDVYGKGATYPVYYVNWYDAIVYCNLRSIAEGLAPCYKLGSETDPKKWIDIQKDNEINPQKYCGPGSVNDNWNTITCDWNANGYRLPTEAEWEYAARGDISDTDKAVWAGTISESELDNYAWYEKNSNGKTHEVKKKNPNDFGLYDMTGNVDEWCWDWYDKKQYTTDKDGISNPKGADTGYYRAERGGDWHDYSQDSRVSFRFPIVPSMRVEFLGFRLVRSL